MSEDSTISPLAYFVAGALLPSLAIFCRRKPFANHNNNDAADDDASSSSDDDDEYESSSLAAVEITGNNKDPKQWDLRDAPYKMVLCVNTELKMGKGKIAAQCSHAAVGCYERATKQCPKGLKAWKKTGCAKIAVKCPFSDIINGSNDTDGNEDDGNKTMMNDIVVKAMKKRIPMYIVEDAGRTQIAAGSRTVLGLGPAPVSAFEGVTSHLKLM